MTGLKSRLIYRQHQEDTTTPNYWAGNYKLIGRAKSIPNPFGDPNMVDVSTLEDLMEVQEEGRRSAPSVAIQIAYEKKYKDEIVALAGKLLDFMVLYGNDGKGTEGIAAFYGTATFSPDDVTEDHLTATVTISIKVLPRWVEDDYTVTVTEDAAGYPTSFTVEAN